MSAPEGIAPWKAHEVRWPGMATTVELSQQPRTESCVVPGSPGNAAISEYAAHLAMRNNERHRWLITCNRAYPVKTDTHYI